MENAERFTGRVTEYERYRTRYPREVLLWLRERCGMKEGWAVADVGAGTGMLAESFLENGNPVTAVEPNAEMRIMCERLQARYPGLSIVDGTAEHTRLSAASVDLVSAGRAFHWFDPAGAAAEFRRVLRPGGWIAIASSGRSKEATEQSQAYEALLLEHGTDGAHVRNRYGRRDRIVAFLRAMSQEEPQHVEFVEDVVMGWEEFLGSTQSMSIAPLAGTNGYQSMREALEKFFARWNEHGTLRVRMVCAVDVARA